MTFDELREAIRTAFGEENGNFLIDMLQDTGWLLTVGIIYQVVIGVFELLLGPSSFIGACEEALRYVAIIAFVCRAACRCLDFAFGKYRRE